MQRRSISLVVAIAIISSAFIVSNVDAKKPKEVWPGVRGGLGDYELADSDAERIVFMAEAIGWPAPAGYRPLKDVGLSFAILDLYAAAGVPITPPLREAVNVAVAQLPLDAADALSAVTIPFADAVRLRDAAFAEVPAWAMSDLGDWVASGFEGAAPEPAASVVGEGFDKSFLLASSLRVIDASNLVRANANVWPSLPVAWQDPLGLIALGTKDSDTYGILDGKWILIDPDGSDTYRNNAGGAAGDNVGVQTGFPSRPLFPGSPGRICVPDLQENPNPDPLPPGTTAGGCKDTVSIPVGLGNNAPVAMAVDLGGDADTYDSWNGAPTWRNYCAQGSGYVGVGYLADDGGNNILESGASSQGAAALAGIGILNLSGSGMDQHINHGQYSIGSIGAASLALFIDWGGNDDYVTFASPSLGAAVGNGGAYFDNRGGVDTYDRHVTGGVAGALTGSTTSTIVRFIERGSETDNYRVAGSPDTSSYPWGNNKSWPGAPDAPRGFDNVFPAGPCPLNGPCS